MARIVRLGLTSTDVDASIRGLTLREFAARKHPGCEAVPQLAQHAGPRHLAVVGVKPSPVEDGFQQVDIQPLQLLLFVAKAERVPA